MFGPGQRFSLCHAITSVRTWLAMGTAEMGSATADCPDCDPEDLCKELRDEIMKRVFQQKSETGTRGLVERVRDQIYGANGPGTPGWDGHDQAITSLKNGIKRLLRQFRDNNCPDLLPIPRNVHDFVDRPNPQPHEWKGPQPAPMVVPTDDTSIWDWEYWEEVTGLTGAALLAYLIISQGSRLYPPRNLVPIP